MNLDDLLKEMKEKMQSRDLSDKYLEENGKMTRTEMGIGEYSYGITTIPCEWVYNFLSDYKKVLKENEELKEEREIVGIPVRNKRDGKIGIVLHQWKNGSVAVLESINPRVINTHDSWNTLEIVTDEVKQTQTKCETIPIQKVKDKIEELKKKVEELTDDKGYWGGSDLLEQIKVLQELLEKEK